MTLHLAGLATALPPHIATQEETAEIFPRFAGADARQTRVLKKLYRRTGVEKRHSVALSTAEGALQDRAPLYPAATGPDDRGPGTRKRMARYAAEAPALAEQVAREALTAAELSPDEITHLVTVSCTGFDAPGFDLHLVDALALDRGVARTHVGFMGCHGALNGLRTAAAYASDPQARVLLCAVELCSLHFAYGWDPEMMVANALFADGAAAVAGWGLSDGRGRSDGSLLPEGRDDPAHGPSGSRSWRLAASGSFVLPDSADAMTWRIGDNGFRMTLSAEVPGLIGEHLRPWLQRWLAGHGLTPEQVKSWAVHPGGPRILGAVEGALELPDGALRHSRDVLREHGNMSSPTILFIMDRLRRAGAQGPCVALAFGPGLAVEAALLV